MAVILDLDIQIISVLLVTKFRRLNKEMDKAIKKEENARDVERNIPVLYQVMTSISQDGPYPKPGDQLSVK